MRVFLKSFGVAALVGALLILYYCRHIAEPATAARPIQTSALTLQPPLTKSPSPAPTTPASETPVATTPLPQAVVPATPKSAAHQIANSSAPQTVIPINPLPAKRGKPPILDPDARAALRFVGDDPDAETYWLQAINDSTLPAEERKDLIEDLNEDGLSDPDHPGPQDLPLIESRLMILDDLAYDPMDKVNADAIREATKDLSKMYADLTGN
jgi:hypothetical protein